MTQSDKVRQKLQDEFSALKSRISARLIGRDELIDRLLIALLVNGHVLLEGPPGLAKTRAVHLLSENLEADFSRIQATPDLMPSDVTGTQIFQPETGQMSFMAGPIFHNLILVDEINRAPPKVQSALLEAMAEGQVTSAGETRKLPKPFIVVATQNSIEQEGTFPLPEAQLDRFLFHHLLELPDADEELSILGLVEDETTGKPTTKPKKMKPKTIQDAQHAVNATHLSEALRQYIVSLVMASRADDEIGAKIAHAISPRGSISLASAARARAFLQGRDYAVPEDVQNIAPDVLAHRLIPTWRALADGENSRVIVQEIIRKVRPI